MTISYVKLKLVPFKDTVVKPVKKTPKPINKPTKPAKKPPKKPVKWIKI